jgi:D-glycero-D-manno-heptose 1,7-bisphosphate phosphatase
MKNVWLNPKFEQTHPQTVVFADRDGTLIRHVDYINDPEQVELLPGVKESVHALLAANIPFFILTNQSGVGRGYFSIDRVYACQEKLFKLLDIEPEQLAGWCIAPEAPEVEGGYRKPSPRFMEEACRLTGIAAHNCHMIGDTLVDLETAWNIGAQAWAVSSGKPELPQADAAGNVNGGDYRIRSDFAACLAEILR